MKERWTFNIDFRDLGIDPGLISRLLNYNAEEDDGIILQMVDKAIREAEEICIVRAEFVIKDKIIIEKGAGTLSIGNLIFNTGKIVAGQLYKSEMVALFACTAGNKIGEEARTLIRNGDFLEGYILDMIGSQAADLAADIMQENLKNVAAETGMAITNRYSPGYCGWDVSEQHKLFAFMPDNHCGISLNASALMNPVKSVSGVIGLGKNVRFNQYTCNLCDQQNCIYRNYKLADTQ